MSTLDSLRVDSRRTTGNDAIEILVNDHNVIKNFLAELAEASPSREVTGLFTK